MTDKEKLTELIIKSVDGCAKNWAETIADYLLQNGVVMLPCKLSVEENPFTHICKSDRVFYPNEFSIYARIIEQNDSCVTIDRFSKFGAVHCGKATISRKDFERYYKELSE